MSTFTPEQLAEIAAAVSDMQGDSSADDLGVMADDDLAVHAYHNRFDGNVTFSGSEGWRYFPDGAHIWITDRKGELVTGAVQAMMRDLRKDEADHKTSYQLGSRRRRDDTVTMLKDGDGVKYQGRWDAAEHLLAAPNGVIDLRTGELAEGSPDQRITKAVTVPYDPGAECPRWEQFLAEVFADTPDMPAYVQRLIGYGVTGSNREQCFAVLFGEGSNGKSVFLTALRKIMGDHAATVPFDQFTVSNRQRGGPDTELLVGARLALASETNRSAVLDSAAIKNATGGEEINVNPKYRDPYTFTPQALILLATNYKPIVKEQDNGTWRRIKLIPFTQRFEGAQRDLSLDDKLKAEYAGILAWAVRGAVEWYANGLQDPDSVRAAVDAYRDESDTLAGFLPGKLVYAPGRWVASADVWGAYREWAEDHGTDAFRSGGTLNKALIERSKGAIEAAKNKGQRGLRGIVRADTLTAEELQRYAPGIFGTDDAAA